MRVLLVGVGARVLAEAASIAVARGAEVTSAVRAEDALAELRRDPAIGLVLCELDQDPASLVRAMWRERMIVPVIACGDETDAGRAVAAIRGGARDFLPLPPDAEIVACLIEAAASATHTMVARDPAMRRLLERAHRVAASDASIMISGESGTGKEILARYVHRKSGRAARPFVAMNCAAIPHDLLESELFGHEKGAFSGAIARRLGKFESASGGTLLLDEVSEMEPRLQAKLLRALQEREIDRVGGSAPVRIDVRVLATSNRDLRAEIEAGRFRADLFFRLNVVTLTLPPLRARIGDIAPLARHYAQHYAALNGLPCPSIADAAIAALERHTWPGNVRELENTMHRAVLLCAGAEIGCGALELDVAAAGPAAAPPGHAAALAPSRPASPAEAQAARADMPAAPFVGRSVDDVERALILETLGHTFGNRTRAATILGISIRALRNKLKAYADDGFAVPRPAAGEAA